MASDGAGVNGFWAVLGNFSGEALGQLAPRGESWHAAPMSLIAVSAGALGAGLTFLFFRLAGIQRNLVGWGVLLVAIACCYPLFAAERFDFSEALWQVIPVVFFAGLVVIGLRAQSPEVIGLGFLLHALFDLAGLPFRFHSPLLWAELCLGYDVAAAIIVRVLATAPSGEHLVDVEDEDRTGA